MNSEKKLSDRERLIVVQKKEAENKWKFLSLAYTMQGQGIKSLYKVTLL